MFVLYFPFPEKTMKLNTPPVSPGPEADDAENDFDIDDIGEVSKQ